MPAVSKRHKVYVALLVGSAVLVGIAALVYSQPPPMERVEQVDLSGPVVESRPPDAHLRLAVTAAWTTEDSMNRYYGLANVLAEGVGEPFRLVSRKTHRELLELMRAGAVHGAILCTGAYLSAQRDGVPVEAVAVPEFSAGNELQALIVVRGDSAARRFEDLRGRAFAFMDPLDFYGHYYPAVLLSRMGTRPAAFFSRTLFTYSQEGSLRAVLDGIADGAAVDGSVFVRQAALDPSLLASLRVVHRSPAMGAGPVVISTASPPPWRDALRRTLLTMHATPEGRDALAVLGIARFREPPRDLYDAARNILAEFHAGGGGAP